MGNLEEVDIYKNVLLQHEVKSTEELHKVFLKYDEQDKVSLFFKLFDTLLEVMNTNETNTIGEVLNMLNLVYQNFQDHNFSDQNGTTMQNYSDKFAASIILLCKYAHFSNLSDFLTHGNDIINFISKFKPILPFVVDEECHNAFYYAIRSNKVDTLKLIMEKWPGNFPSNVQKLDAIVSDAYEELKLKNVQLTDEMEYYVESTLTSLRFFCDKPLKTFGTSILTLKERINILLENMQLLLTDHKDDNDLFLFTATQVAKNIQILKNLIMCTYISLPWEEFEFYIICYVYYRTKMQELSLFFIAIQKKDIFLNHLKCFKEALEEEMEILNKKRIHELRKLGRINREDMIEGILIKYPQFEALCKDYKYIRNIYTLDKITTYIEIAQSVDVEQKEGQLVIVRALQIVGEHLKNSIQSPKLSNSIIETLFVSAPNYTKDIMTDLRNSLSHSEALIKRTNLEKETADNFEKLKNDLQKINIVITDLSYKIRINILEEILNTLKHTTVSESTLDMLREFRRIPNVESKLANKLDIYSKVDELLVEASAAIEVTQSEKELMKKIRHILITRSDRVKKCYNFAFSILTVYGKAIFENIHENEEPLKISHNSNILKMFDNLRVKETMTIKGMIKSLFKSWVPRLTEDNSSGFYKVIYYITYLLDIEAKSITSIEKLQENLSIPKKKKNADKEVGDAANENVNDLLDTKLRVLAAILNNNDITDETLASRYSIYKHNTKLQAAIEMLTLDVMSILEKQLENNHFTIDDSLPTLNGKIMRNHLAHSNALVDILPTDTVKTVLASARILTRVITPQNVRAIGRMMKDNPTEIKKSIVKNIQLLKNQKLMFGALEQGDLDTFNDLIKNGADIYGSDVNKQTALHYASKGDKVELVKTISEAVINTNTKDLDGRLASHYAALHGRIHILQYLVIDKKQPVNSPDKYGKTPLHLAAQNGHSQVVQFLIDNDANVKIKDSIHNYTALNFATKNMHTDVARILLECEDTAATHAMTLQIAAKYGNVDIAKNLLLNKVDPNTNLDDDTSLHLASRNGHLEIVKLLIDYGSNINCFNVKGQTALHSAVIHQQTDITTYLLQYGASPNSRFDQNIYTPLHHAAEQGNKDILEALLFYKADIDATSSNNVTALHLAAMTNRKEIMEILINGGANINIQTLDGATPLHLCLVLSQIEAIRLLLEKGADVNISDNIGRTPLLVAIECSKKDLIEDLIGHGAALDVTSKDGSSCFHFCAQGGNIENMKFLINRTNYSQMLNAKNDSSMTPLHIAVQKAHVEMIDLLLNDFCQYINLNAKDSLGQTPLHYAVTAKSIEFVEKLLQNNVNVDEANNSGETALHLASSNGSIVIAKMLISKGANMNLVCVEGMTPICFAVHRNDAEMVKMLISHGVHRNLGTMSCLSRAIHMGYKKILSTLLEADNIEIDFKHPKNTNLLHTAASRNQPDVVQILLQKGMDVNTFDEELGSALYIACGTGHKEVVDVLLANGAFVDFVSSLSTTPLHVAAGYGHIAITEALIRSGADLQIKDVNGKNAIQLATIYNQLSTLKLLLRKEHMDERDESGQSLLHIAATLDDPKITEYLINNGLNIHLTDNNGDEPINVAAKLSNVKIIEVYLKNGISISALYRGNDSLLHASCASGNLVVSKYLIDKGIDLNLINDMGLTALKLSIFFTRVEVVKLLLKSGAHVDNLALICHKSDNEAEGNAIKKILSSISKLFAATKENSLSEVTDCLNETDTFVDVRNTGGLTPLLLATIDGYEKIVDILLRKKAAPNATNNEQWTSLHFAAKTNNLGICTKLLTYGTIYNPINAEGKTPLHLTDNEDIKYIFETMDSIFGSLSKKELNAVDIIKAIQNPEVFKVLPFVRNRENKTIITEAMINNVPYIANLETLLENTHIRDTREVANILYDSGLWEEALDAYIVCVNDMEQLFDPITPEYLNIKMTMAKCMYELKQNTSDIVALLTDICHRYEEMLGKNNSHSLGASNFVAFIKMAEGKPQNAFDIYTKSFQRCVETLGDDNEQCLESLIGTAEAARRMGKFELSLKVCESILNMKHFDPNNKLLLDALHVKAMALKDLGKLIEASIILENIYDKKKTSLGPYCSNTVETLRAIADVHLKNKDYESALGVLESLSENLAKRLSSTSLNVLAIKFDIANVLTLKLDNVSAVSLYDEIETQLEKSPDTGYYEIVKIKSRNDFAKEMFDSFP